MPVVAVDKKAMEAMRKQSSKYTSKHREHKDATQAAQGRDESLDRSDAGAFPFLRNCPQSRRAC